MTGRLIFAHETHDELNFDTAGRPLHCSKPMEDDYELHSCTRCFRNIQTALVIGERTRRGIKRTY